MLTVRSEVALNRLVVDFALMPKSFSNTVRLYLNKMKKSKEEQILLRIRQGKPWWHLH